MFALRLPAVAPMCSQERAVAAKKAASKTLSPGPHSGIRFRSAPNRYRLAHDRRTAGERGSHAGVAAQRPRSVSAGQRGRRAIPRMSAPHCADALTTRLRSRRARRRNSLDNGRNAEVSKSGTTGLLRMQVLEHDVIVLRARQRLRPFSGHRSEFDVSEATRKAHGEGRLAAAGAQVRGNGSCRNACCTRDGGCSDSRSARPGRGRSHGDNRHNGGGNCADDSDADHTVTEPSVGIEMAPRVARNSRLRGCSHG